MFCPKCGRVMTETSDGLFYCEPGEMYLTKYLSDTFRRQFIERSEPTPEAALGVRIGGPYYCPACGRQMVEREGAIRCDVCRLNMTRYIHPLITHCPHRGASGRWEL